MVGWWIKKSFWRNGINTRRKQGKVLGSNIFRLNLRVNKLKIEWEYRYRDVGNLIYFVIKLLLELLMTKILQKLMVKVVKNIYNIDRKILRNHS